MARKAAKSDKIVVRVFGTPEIRVGEHRIGLSTEALFAVALYLTTRAGERVGKDELLDMFWPEGDLEARRHAMRQMMYRLRKMGIQPQSHGETVLLPQEQVDSDLGQLLTSTSAKAVSVDPDTLGPIFSDRLPNAFMEWFDSLRSRITSYKRTNDLDQLAHARKEARWSEVERWAERILAYDPLNEEAVLARAEGAAMAGARATAIRILDSYLDELGDSAADIGKPAMLLRKRIAERRRPWSGSGASDVALVGRTSLVAMLLRIIEGTSHNNGSSVSLVGPGGIGKTRIAAEAAECAAINGVRMIALRAEPSRLSHPLGVLSELVDRLLAQPGALGASPPQLSLLRNLIDRTRQREPIPSDQLSSRSLSAALAELLLALSESGRLLVLIDDGHNVDSLTREVLTPCIALEGTRISWIITSRTGPYAWKPGRQTLSVPPLSRAEATTLASLVFDALGHLEPGTTAEDLARWSGGNPLFVREIAIHRKLSLGHTESLPASLQDTIRSRLSGLSDAQVLVLRTVAYLGASATLARTIAASGLPSSEVGETISQLEIDGLLFLDSRGTLGLHECWMQEVFATTPGAAEAAISFECAKAITAGGLALLLHEECWRAGNLFSRAGALTEAIQCYLGAIDQMLARGLLSQAAAALKEAKDAAGSSTAQLGLLSRTAELLLAQGEIEAAARCLDSMPRTREDAVRRGEDLTEWVLCQAYRHDALAKHRPDTLVDTQSLLAAVRCDSAAAFARHTAAFIGARSCLWQDDLEGLRHFYELGSSIGDPHEMTLARGFLEILFLAELGDAERFLEANRRLEQLETSFAPLRLLHTSKRYRATGLRMHGFLDEAIRISTQVLLSSRAVDQNDNACASAELIAFILLDQEMPKEAQRFVECALDATPPQSNTLRLKGLAHANNRCRWQRGDAAGATAAMRPNLRQLEQDANRTRRFGELLTYAVTSLESGEDEAEARRIVDAVAKELVDMTPTGISDYPAEMLLRSMRLSCHPDFEDASNRLIAKRRKHFNRPIAPFFRELNRGGDFPIAVLSQRTLSGTLVRTPQSVLP